MAPQTRLQSKLQNMNNTQNSSNYLNNNTNNKNNNNNSHNGNNNSWSMWWVVLMFMCMFTLIVWVSIEMSNFYEYRPVLDCVDYGKQYLNETWLKNYYTYDVTA